MYLGVHHVAYFLIFALDWCCEDISNISKIRLIIIVQIIHDE